MRIEWTPRELRVLLKMRNHNEQSEKHKRARVFDLFEKLYLVHNSTARSKLLASMRT